MRVRLIMTMLAAVLVGKAEAQYDSLAFHLYTDSLKKGVANYISVDGKRSKDGRWWPLTTEEVSLSSTAGMFEGNDLWIDSSFSGDSIVVTALLKNGKLAALRQVIYMKRNLTERPLKTEEEILRSLEPPARNNRRRNKA